MQRGFEWFKMSHSLFIFVGWKPKIEVFNTLNDELLDSQKCDRPQGGYFHLKASYLVLFICKNKSVNLFFPRTPRIQPG